MTEHYFHIQFDPERTLQEQIREHLVNLILTGKLKCGSSMPSTRSLSKMLKVSRNTIVLIYESLEDSGYLTALDRKGFVVADLYLESPNTISKATVNALDDSTEWSTRFKKRPSFQRNIVKPNNWQSFEYPFIYGQIQHDFFPLEQWRDASKKSMSVGWNKYWINDMVESDDPFLVEQIRTRILPRRGIYAEANEIIVTIGTQNSLFLLASLLCSAETKVALENPGFREAANIFSFFDASIIKQPVDSQGITVDQNLDGVDYVFVTPSTQVPTGVELTDRRRQELLQTAQKNDFIIIEDDYDAEINMNPEPKPALKAQDNANRVVYLGSMSKALSPGLRMGFIVASEELVAEIRSLRRTMYRHPPVNNQRQFGLFLSLGYYDSYLRKIREIHASKLARMVSAIEEHLPDMRTAPDVNLGATSMWLRAPEHLNTEEVSWVAARESILIEPGAIHFISEPQPKNYFRLGFSAIDAEKIEPGIAALKSIFDQL